MSEGHFGVLPEEVSWDHAEDLSAALRYLKLAKRAANRIAWI